MTLDLPRFKERVLDKFDIEAFRAKMFQGQAVDLGSRTFLWRLFLGVIPEENNHVKWVEAIRQERQEFYRKTEELKITKSKDLDPRFFNPLAATENNPWESHFKDKDVRDLIQ
jgi:TBC1 domain family member 5